MIIPEDNDKVPKNLNIYKRDVKNVDRENFLLDLIAVDWDKVLDLEKNDPNESFNRLEIIINPIIDTYLPLKKVTKKEAKNHFKPWITPGIRKSIQSREKLYKKFIKQK